MRVEAFELSAAITGAVAGVRGVAGVTGGVVGPGWEVAEPAGVELSLTLFGGIDEAALSVRTAVSAAGGVGAELAATAPPGAKPCER